MRVHRLAAWITLPVTVALTIAACDTGGLTPVAGTVVGSAVTIGIAEPEHLIPSDTVESNGFQVISSLYTPLVRFDDSGKPVLDQAAAASITTKDNKVWMVKLKDGFTFHNGQKVTADSYIKAWNFGAYGPNAQIGTDFYSRIQGYDAMQSSTSKKPKATKLSGVKKIDDLTIQITLSAPFAEFEKVLGYNVFYPLPDAAYAADGTLTTAYEDNPIGDGPFQIKGSWNHNQSIDVIAYPDYPLDKPKVNEVDFKIYQDQDTMYADLQAGELDIEPQIPSDKLASAQVDLGDRLKQTPSSYFAYISVPTWEAAYKNVDVRRAISMAIDRQQIIDKIFQGSYAPATSWVSPVVEGARANTCGDACKYNPVAAKQLYQAAKGPNKIQLYYNADGGHKEWVDAVCNQLAKNLAVQCVGSPVVQLADLRKQARAHSLKGLLRSAWAFDYPSIEDYLTPLYKAGAASNDSDYDSPEFEQAIKQADGASDEATAIKGYQKAEDIIAQDMPTIPMWFKQNIYGYSTSMKNVDMDLFANVNVMTLERN
ncbi:peptide ABC transporter substrate-binding protein [Rugosimonospora africana]|uniref:Peptide ABC transporter substrate-binding protein n=1 Tax=Rugosimonospora africana TaxID=556532 RepID=A0A8J3VMA9_9ACTN|nr:ABC transporter substrate-binding protein [Rugosimonospora africana]GIH12129.1 peptide ABC transporter substrate-binding protein [Rugosimonospora africana]